MTQTLRIAFAALALPLAVTACNGSSTTTATEDAGGSDKTAYEAAAALVAQPVALISAYQPHLHPPDPSDVYTPKHRSEIERAGTASAGEIRFAANSARQKLKPSTPALKDLELALANISAACTDASDIPGFDKCNASVTALDAALSKTGAAAQAAGMSGKFPHVGPDSVNDEAKKAMKSFLTTLGPGPAEQAYAVKRSDPKAAFADVAAACQAAADEISGIAAAYEHADEPIRLIAVTHKMSIDAQCHTLGVTDTMRSDLADCKKKPKTPECKVTCSKVRTRIDDGIPAAVFATLPENADKICVK